MDESRQEPRRRVEYAEIKYAGFTGNRLAECGIQLSRPTTNTAELNMAESNMAGYQ